MEFARGEKIIDLTNAGTDRLIISGKFTGENRRAPSKNRFFMLSFEKPGLTGDYRNTEIIFSWKQKT